MMMAVMLKPDLGGAVVGAAVGKISHRLMPQLGVSAVGGDISLCAHNQYIQCRKKRK
jgi:hypothetical protein